MNYGRYQVTREAGRGSMGVVYEAQDPQIGRVVAIKVLRHDRAGDEALVQRFLREAKAIGRLSHPRIVTIYDAAEDRGNVYIAMEFVQGRPLKQVIQERRLTIDEILDIGAQVADTLHYAHEKGVVHRDIKPSNIILQPDGQIKITDFGIARIEGSTATLQTQAGETMGTPAYMSPEQVLGKPVDRRTDLFSLGVILYELSTGNRPFGGPGATLPTIFKEIVQDAPVVPASAAIPGAVSAVILKCLKKSTDERYQTGLELADALRRQLGRQEKKAAPLPDPSASGEPVRPTVSAVTVLVGTVLAVGAIAAGLGVFRYHTRVGTKPLAAAAIPAPTPPPPQTRPQVHAVAPQSLPTSAVPRPDDLPSRPKERPPPPPRLPHAEERSVRERPLARIAKPAPAAQRPTALIDLTVPSTPLKVISIPEGASISIDGRTVGRAPATFMVSVGRHRLHATHAGSRDADAEVDVRETMEYPIRLFLEPAQ